MVKTLLDLVEGRSATPLREAMIRLERGVRGLITEASGSAPAIDDRRQPEKKAPPEIRETEPAPLVAPVGPVLVPNQTVQGRIPTARPPKPMPAPLDEGGDALVELTSFARANADETVKERP